MKRHMILIAVVVTGVAFAGEGTNRFHGGNFDGYEQNQLIQPPPPGYLALVNARFEGGSYDGYHFDPVTDTSIVMVLAAHVWKQGGSLAFDRSNHVVATTPTNLQSIAVWCATGDGWHHYCEVGTNQYVDGVAGSFGSSFWNYNSEAGVITNGLFTGLMGDPMYTYSYALTPSEVATLYAEQARFRNYSAWTNNLATVQPLIGDYPASRSGSTNLLTEIRLDPGWLPSGTAAWNSWQTDDGEYTITPSGGPIVH